MATKDKPHPQPAGKSKTDLRRGQFTPGMARPKKEVARRGGGGASLDEQAMLFDEGSGEET